MPCNEILTIEQDSNKIQDKQQSDLADTLRSNFKNYSTTLTFYVNNSLKVVQSIDPRTTVLEYLRENGYCGTKLGCNEGGCGACTIVLAVYDRHKGAIKYKSANSCILPLCSANNKQIITVEGIGNMESPHPIQDRLAKGHGSQCGFCTPGIVMSFYSLLKINPTPSMHDIEEAFDGNLCRCTGYRPILDTFKSFSAEATSCGSNDSCGSGCGSGEKKLVDFTEFKPYDPTLDVPFPKDLIRDDFQPFIMSKNGITWLEPTSLSDLLKAKRLFPDARLIGGSSEVSIEMKFKAANYLTFFNALSVKDLEDIRVVDDKLEIGCSITLTDLISELKEMTASKSTLEHHKSLYQALLANLKYFASRQVRNFATLGGNIATGSPISDLNPIFMANDALLTILSENGGTRTVPIRKFYLGYRKIDLKPDEILLKVTMDLPKNEMEIVKAYKQAKRKEDDIAIVNGCFRVRLVKEASDYKIDCLDLSYGGLAPTTIYLPSINDKFRGAVWGNDQVLKSIYDELLALINFSYSVPGGMPTYRRTLALSFFTRFWYQVIKQLKIPNCPPENLHNIDEIERAVSKSSQDFGAINREENSDLIGTTNPHLSGLNQTTGVAKYLDDIPKQQGEVYTGFVLSTKPHAIIKSINAAKALAVPGVVDFISSKDIDPKKNIFGLGHDDEVFASRVVRYNGQLIGLVLAESRSIARYAAGLVEIEYEPLKPIFTIREAIENNSFYDLNRELKRGDIDDSTFTNVDENSVVIEGEMEVGGQEHFYLETHGCLAIPKLEDNEYVIYSSTQNVSEVQKEAAHVLGIPANRVVCKIKRIGGGFGGKETRASYVALATVLAAKKVGRPVRCIVDRDVDMVITGARHPFYGKYKLKLSKDGKFQAYDVELINNAGYSLDLSWAVMEGALFRGVDNVYMFPNIRIRCKLAKTNVTSNTAFRGFGAPQAMMITETMVTEAAERLGMSVDEIREKNMFKENDITHYDMPVEDWFVPEMWHKIQADTKYQELRRETDEFNKVNKWKKRGLAIIPTKFPISFTQKFMNQAAALVHVYTDGSVLVNHNGIEMGQGLHTKIVQIAADTLKISPSLIYVSETSTDKVPNGSPSAASASTDLNGMAVQIACQKLFDRLQPYRTKNPTGTLAEWAWSAYMDRVDLCAHGFYATPQITYDHKTNKGRMFAYFTCGIAVALVELDVLTGDHVVLRSDLLMDIGQSINYAVDIGQIEGAFIQGVGLFTMEELLVQSSSGASLTRGPGNYKIPGFGDVPREFNVSILQGKTYKHLKTVKSSKGIGEPPLFMGSVVFFALRDAVCAARKQNGVNTPLTGFISPCTAEVLRLACADELINKSKVEPKIINGEQEKLWSIRP